MKTPMVEFIEPRAVFFCYDEKYPLFIWDGHVWVRADSWQDVAVCIGVSDKHKHVGDYPVGTTKKFDLERILPVEIINMSCQYSMAVVEETIGGN